MSAFLSTQFNRLFYPNLSATMPIPKDPLNGSAALLANKFNELLSIIARDQPLNNILYYLNGTMLAFLCQWNTEAQSTPTTEPISLTTFEEYCPFKDFTQVFHLILITIASYNLIHLLTLFDHHIQNIPYNESRLFPYACMADSQEVVTYLLDLENLDINQTDKWGGPGLVSAASQNHIAICYLLLLSKHPLNVNVTNYWNETPLYIFLNTLRAQFSLFNAKPELLSFYVTTLKILLQCSDIDIYTISRNRVSIHHVMSKLEGPAFEEIKNLVFEIEDRNINHRNQFGFTALYYACVVHKSYERAAQIVNNPKANLFPIPLSGTFIPLTNGSIQEFITPPWDPLQFFQEHKEVGNWSALIEKTLLARKIANASKLANLIVFLSDDFLRIPQASASKDADSLRFFTLSQKLPLDLQMLLSLRTYGDAITQVITPTQFEQGYSFWTSSVTLEPLPLSKPAPEKLGAFHGPKLLRPGKRPIISRFLTSTIGSFQNLFS